jgi:predicted DNA-binding transcriptional regulator AlpA
MGSTIRALIACGLALCGMVAVNLNGQERRTYDIEQVATMLGCSRNHAYLMAREQVFPTIHLGRRIVCPKRQFDAWLNGEQQ